MLFFLVVRHEICLDFQRWIDSPVFGFSYRCLEEQEKPRRVLGSENYPLLKPSLKITSHPENRHGSPEKTELWFPAHSSSEVIVFWHSLTIFLFSVRSLVTGLLFFLLLWFSNHSLRFCLWTFFDWNESTILFLACCQTCLTSQTVFSGSVFPDHLFCTLTKLCERMIISIRLVDWCKCCCMDFQSTRFTVI